MCRRDRRGGRPHLDVRGRAVGTGGSLCAGRAGRALGPGLTLGSLDALLSLRALRAGRTLRASCALHALGSLRTHNLTQINGRHRGFLLPSDV